MSEFIGNPARQAGACDFDSYRTSATALRRQAMRDGKTIRAVRAALMTLFSVLCLAVLVATAPTPASRGHAAMAQTEAAQLW